MHELCCRANEASAELLEAWYEKRSDDAWDQSTLDDLVMGGDVAFHESTRLLDFNEFPNGCCRYCGDLMQSVFQRDQEWQPTCSADLWARWVSFHVACAQAPVDYSSGVDLSLLKRDMLISIYHKITGLLLS